jgi:endonuclease/exonuclease/phosphatase (EEP) superfamily protein YafD
LAACSLMGLLSPAYWLFDLFNHFRIHALVASVLLLGAALAFSRKDLLLASIVLAGNGIIFLMPIYQSSGISDISSQNSEQVRIVSANVYTANTQRQRAIDVITRENPDIIALTETDGRWVNHFSSIEDVYPHTLKHPRPDNFGIAVYSKLHFKAEILIIGDYRLPLAVLDFERFRLIVAHPIPPLSLNNMQENKLYLEVIAQNLRLANKPTIIAGDLNTTLWGEAIGPLVDAGFKRINPTGIAYTWPTQNPLFAMQIDHFFATGIEEANFRVLADIGSDHYPIQAVISLQSIR